MKKLIIVFSIVSFSAQAQLDKNSEAYKTILKLDQEFFSYYNTCEKNLEKYANFYAEDLEFFHDKGGLSTSKKETVEATKKNICGKVTRTLLKESVEVHEIPNYGFIEIGYHTFFNKEEPNAKSKPSKFITFWKRINNQLKIAKVVSLH